jgi:hypothetical protein
MGQGKVEGRQLSSNRWVAGSPHQLQTSMGSKKLVRAPTQLKDWKILPVLSPGGYHGKPMRTNKVVPG